MTLQSPCEYLIRRRSLLGAIKRSNFSGRRDFSSWFNNDKWLSSSYFWQLFTFSIYCRGFKCHLCHLIYQRELFLRWMMSVRRRRISVGDDSASERWTLNRHAPLSLELSSSSVGSVGLSPWQYFHWLEGNQTLEYLSESCLAV